MAQVIDFAYRIQAQRDLEYVAYPRDLVRDYQQPKPERTPFQYEERTCASDGRTYVIALGSADNGFCRPLCAEAEARAKRRRS